MDLKEYTVTTVMVAVWLIIQMTKKPVMDRFGLRDYIPLIAGFLGIAFVFWINGRVDFVLFLQGLASGFAATGMNESVNVLFYKDEDTPETN